jgi:glucose-6-phosphate 1-dehydrogenase
MTKWQSPINLRYANQMRNSIWEIIIDSVHLTIVHELGWEGVNALVRDTIWASLIEIRP